MVRYCYFDVKDASRSRRPIAAKVNKIMGIEVRILNNFNSIFFYVIALIFNFN